MQTQTVEIKDLLPWGEPKQIYTTAGPRMLRTAAPDENFWNLWRAAKDSLKRAGISCGQYKGVWQVCWWTLPEAKVTQARDKALEASRATDADVSIPVPDGLAYLPFQKAGIAYALERPGTYIGDEMGLGKTIQAIGVINGDKEIKRVLVICTATLKVNWWRELRKWLVRPLTVGIADGKNWPMSSVVIINYDVLKNYVNGRLSGPWDLIVVDEAQYITNPKAKRTQCVVGHVPKRGESNGYIPALFAPRKIAMSGTPLNNRPMDLWTVISWVDPGTWKPKEFFKFARRYCDAKHGGFGWNFSGASNLGELQTKLRTSCMIRRLKADVLVDLPDKTRQIIELPSDGLDELLQEEQQAQGQAEAAIADLEAAAELSKADADSEGAEAKRQAFEAEYGKLQKGMGVAFQEMARVAHEVALAKVERSIEFIEECMQNGKVIVFAHHLDVIARLRQAFPKNACVIGGMQPENKMAQVDRFQKEPECNPFIGGIRAAAEGITLTAASTVIFVEEDWTPSKMQQCEDRAHRIGQKDNVTAYYLVLNKSLDVRKVEVLISKMRITDAALDKRVPTPDTAKPLVCVDAIRVTEKQLAKESQAIPPQVVEAVLVGLKHVAGVCNGARDWDDMGFSKFDTALGKSLAAQGRLTPKQAVYGLRLAKKYRRQIENSAPGVCGVIRDYLEKEKNAEPQKSAE